jgi:DNA repair exonuclease SbcCD ATPase subunit
MHHVGAGLADAMLAGVRLRVEELRAAADVLGLRGPRTTVLAGALGGITAGANDWLRRLGGGIQIELRPYTETRSGGTTGAIEIKVRGAGGGEGYKACSSGERRRIDVALLFGLGEVASAARGGRQSTMWCDEILTHLDEDGIAGAVEAIREVARERCVVVIEQERNIAVEMLHPDRVVRLKKG